MKRTDLEKQLGHKINNQISKGNAAGFFNKSNSAPVDKREQRKLDKAKGLIPFAVKLNEELVARLNKIAEEQNIPVNELVAKLLTKGIEK